VASRTNSAAALAFVSGRSVKRGQWHVAQAKVHGELAAVVCKVIQHVAEGDVPRRFAHDFATGPQPP
jgi:hypothetical protein